MFQSNTRYDSFKHIRTVLGRDPYKKSKHYKNKVSITYIGLALYNCILFHYGDVIFVGF